MILGLQLIMGRVTELRPTKFWLHNTEAIFRLVGNVDSMQLKSHLVLAYNLWTEIKWVIDKIIIHISRNKVDCHIEQRVYTNG